MATPEVTCSHCQSSINHVTKHCDCGHLAEFECTRCKCTPVMASGSQFCPYCNARMKERGQVSAGRDAAAGILSASGRHDRAFGRIPCKKPWDDHRNLVYDERLGGLSGECPK